MWTFLIVGLMAMHGVGSHGTTAHASAPADVLASPTGHAEQPGIDDSGGGGEEPGHSAAEICLAILCALISALAAFVALTRPRHPVFTALRATSLPQTPPWLRPPDPPCLIHLSILRC
ncbi:DUF6153 family protein [Nocardioides sp.]|uniref:DUF6153 family protein n=1 Tax=Nocardioides sp. TaxID=35761 RepID=UPI0039C9097F